MPTLPRFNEDWQELIDAGWDEAHIEQKLVAGWTLDELVAIERREQEDEDARTK